MELLVTGISNIRQATTSSAGTYAVNLLTSPIFYLLIGWWTYKILVKCRLAIRGEEDSNLTPFEEAAIREKKLALDSKLLKEVTPEI